MAKQQYKPVHEEVFALPTIPISAPCIADWDIYLASEVAAQAAMELADIPGLQLCCPMTQQAGGGDKVPPDNPSPHTVFTGNKLLAKKV